MYNWNTNTAQLKKDAPQYDKFVLEQQINFGLNNTKLSLEKLIKHWDRLHIDPIKRNYLENIIWTYGLNLN